MSSVFGLPLVLDGSSLRVLVVGGGMVATRKTLTLAARGAAVRVRAPRVRDELMHRAAIDEKIVIELAPYDSEAIREATLVVAATNDADVNAVVAADAKRMCRLVLVVDEPESGNCIMPAVHHAGDLLVAVTAGGVPGASKRVRDELSRRFDDRYATALAQLSELRARLLARNDRSGWHAAACLLLADDFCDSVESGAFNERLARWH